MSAATGKVVLASSLVGLTKSGVDLSESKGLASLVKSTYDWMVRERIDERMYNKCVELASNLAFPNDAGYDLLQKIEQTDRNNMEKLRKVGGLEIFASGSLGRLIGVNPELAYIVTTVAALAHNRDESFAAKAICSMIFDKGNHEQGVSLTHNAYRVPAEAVFLKIVQSVYLNVTNAGHNLPDLPEKLKDYHHHLLDDRTFAGVVMGIHRRVDDIVVHSANLLIDLTTWLYYHFQGVLRLVIQGKIVLEEVRGSSAQIITLMVDNSCRLLKGKCSGTDGYIVASVNRGGEAVTFLNGRDDADYRPRSFVRQPLYTLDNVLGSARADRPGVLKKGDKNTLEYNAKLVLKWLIDRPLEPQQTLKSGMMFQVITTPDSTTTLHLRDLFQRFPQLLHSPTGEISLSKPVFRFPEEVDDGEEFFNQAAMEGIEYDDWKRNRTTVGTIESWFPYLSDALEDLRRRCSCHQCDLGTGLDEAQEGCLRAVGITYFLLLIACGITDAMGLNDISGLAEAGEVVKAVLQLFHEIVQEQMIRWDTYVEVAATVAAGCPYSAFEQAGETADTSSAWAAIQYGSFVISASWLDLSSWKFDIRPFSLIQTDGKIAGIPDDFGMLQCEMFETQEEESVVQRAADGPDPDHDLLNQPDTVFAQLFYTIFPAAQFTYRLMTTVRSGAYEKIVDPSVAAMTRFYVRMPQCVHSPEALSHETILGSALGEQMEIHDFDQALGRWSNPVTEDQLLLSKTVDSALKVNALVAICLADCVIQEQHRCCLACAREAAAQNRSSPRRIIRLSLPHGKLAMTASGSSTTSR